MKVTKGAGTALALLMLALTPQRAVAQAKDAAKPAEKQSSAYVQCDGQPNNVTAGETAARLLGAVTLLGLFAPPPEAADATKRRFGADGVAVCTALIDGEKREGNFDRRQSLILARALHRIEAKEYDAAIADAELARAEAKAAGQLDDPYFALSRGTAFDWIAGTAQLRKGQVPAARDAMLAPLPAIRWSALRIIAVPEFAPWQRDASDAELAFLTQRSRTMPIFGDMDADRLEELGRFQDAARLRVALVDLDAAMAPARQQSLVGANAAIALQLAGDRDKAAAVAATARANFEARQAGGQPEATEAAYVEAMDLYAILVAADAGQMDKARRLFAARSQWTTASFGAVMETNRRLRAGAPAADLIGGLEATPDQLWARRAETRRALALKQDGDNASLFRLMPTPITAAAYESLSKSVWQTEKSKMLLKMSPPKNGEAPSKFETLFAMGQPLPLIDGYMLHAALLAKSRGHQSFIMVPLVTQGIVAARILTGAPDSPGLPAALANDADATIAALSPLIPSPEALKTRRAAAEQAARKKAT